MRSSISTMFPGHIAVLPSPQGGGGGGEPGALGGRHGLALGSPEQTRMELEGLQIQSSLDMRRRRRIGMCFLRDGLGGNGGKEKSLDCSNHRLFPRKQHAYQLQDPRNMENNKLGCTIWIAIKKTTETEWGIQVTIGHKQGSSNGSHR